jgi:formamidopyrimidine-DNA glycosylase
MDITIDERMNLFKAIIETIEEAIKLGGRYDEVDLFGNNGGYIRLMDKKTQDTPCINCQTSIQKFSYLGGACYVCPNCQT